jgi:hypothetical protein
MIATLPHHKKVILSMPSPKSWTIFAYVTESGRNVYEDWDAGQTDEAEEMLRALLKGDRKTADYRGWMLWRHRMRDKAGEAGIVELGFKSGDKQIRVLCVFKGEKCIVILCICFHKMKVWTPPKAIDSAIERAKSVTAGRANLDEIESTDNL